MWGRAIETGFLEDPWNGPTKDCYSYTDDPAFPPVEDEVVIEFKEGVPVKIDGRDVTPLQAIEEMNRRAGAQASAASTSSRTAWSASSPASCTRPRVPWPDYRSSGA